MLLPETDMTSDSLRIPQLLRNLRLSTTVRAAVYSTKATRKTPTPWLKVNESRTSTTAQRQRLWLLLVLAALLRIAPPQTDITRASLEMPQLLRS